MRLCNLGHAAFLAGDKVVVDPFLPGGALEPCEVADVDLTGVDHVVLTSADPLHAHAPTLRALLPGRTLVAPAAVLERIGAVAELAASVIAIATFQSVHAGGIEWTALPADGDAASTLLARAGTAAVWFLGTASIDRNRALLLADRLDGHSLLAVLSTETGHLLGVLNGTARGFPEAAVAERIRTTTALRAAGFTVALTGGVHGTGALAWANAFVAPVSSGRLARELGVVATQAGRWISAAGESTGTPLPARVLGEPRFDPSLGIADLAGDGALVPDLAELVKTRLGRLRDKLAYGFHASLVEWGVRVEIRELAAGGAERRTLVVFEPDDVRVETDPAGAGTITIAISASALAALLAGDRLVEELCIAGALRTSERVVAAHAGVSRPSWVGLQQPAETHPMCARGHVLSPLALAGCLAPDARIPAWPDRWAGES